MRCAHRLCHLFPAVLLIAASLVSCLPQEEAEVPATENASASSTRRAYSSNEKMSLWTNGTQLRGANIYQRRVFLEVDGNEFMGPGPFGPPYTQEDFDRLASMGANFVDISTAGLFSVTPPYQVDDEAVASLDSLLEMAAEADMFAVITFRTGPGRSEFAIIGGGDWLPDGYIIDTVWTDETARAAWADMWRFAAERYRDNPNVIGYDLMCEPNSNALLDIWEPETFQDQYARTGYDWNSWYPRLISAIRNVDATTPILVGGNGFSDIAWLPYVNPSSDPLVIYSIHQYSPHEYTHQEPPHLSRSYPGYLDPNDDGSNEVFNRNWVENLLLGVSDFIERYSAPVVVNEFGVERWEPGAAKFVGDEMDLFEQQGWNYAVWLWSPAWPPLLEGDNSFNFRLGSDPSNRTEVQTDLMQAYIDAFSRNSLRPSNHIK